MIGIVFSLNLLMSRRHRSALSNRDSIELVVGRRELGVDDLASRIPAKVTRLLLEWSQERS